MAVFNCMWLPVGCLLSIIAAGCGNKHHDIVARAGSVSISPKDLQYQIDIERAYGYDSIQRCVAFVQLVNTTFENIASDSLKTGVSEDDLKEFNRHVEINTKNRDILEKVKKVFGQDTAAYDTFFLAPKLINNKNRGHYYADSSLHAGTRDIVQRAYNLTLINKNFSEIASLTGAIYEMQWLDPLPASENAGAETDGLPRISGSFLLPVAQNLKPGEIAPSIIDGGSAWFIIRLIEQLKDGLLKVELLTVRKKSYDDFLLDIIRKNPVEIYDEEIKKELLQRYGNLNWVETIRENQLPSRQ